MKRPAPSRWLRIDDRLLHGQVMVAWAAALRPRRIILASDVIAADAERRAVYAALPHDDADIAVTTLEDGAAELRTGDRVLVVCASPSDARHILEAGAPLDSVQIGGLHVAEGKRRWLDYAWLSPADSADLQALLARGVRVEGRDLPGSRAVALDAETLVALWAHASGDDA